jgi:hypothetical protein
MTAGAPVRSMTPSAGRSRPVPGRLLRLELRRNAMLWMMPVAAALFWFSAYRHSMARPPLWNMRAMAMQHDVLLDFVFPVVGAAAWIGSRDGRRHTADLVSVTARPRWGRQLAAWSATTCWALVAYLGCVSILYAVTARQAAWGGPPWWPAAVGAAGVPVLTAVGFAAGAFFPSRFTAPLVTIGAFFGLGFTDPVAHGGQSYGQISPLIAGAVDIGPDPGVGIFYHYLPDLAIAQVIFLAGLAATVLGILGLPAGSGGRWRRRSAAATAVAGLLAAGTAVALVGTARLDRHGMMTIPALHDAANDRPVGYTPVCSRTAIPVCLHPAYTAYLAAVAAALEPVLSEVAGLPGAPARISQVAPVWVQQSGNGTSISGPGRCLCRPRSPGAASPAVRGPQVVPLTLPSQLPGQQQPAVTTAQFAAQIRSGIAPQIVAGVLPVLRQSHGRAGHQDARQAAGAQRAVAAALLADAGLPFPRTGSGGPGRDGPGRGIAPPGTAVSWPGPGTAVYAAAQRFAALPPAARHAWLAAHLAALRAGRLTLAQLP